MLYADTALGGEEAPTKCGHAFFGTSKCLFATDAPFDPDRGRALIADTLKGVRTLGLPQEETDAILAGNARTLLRL
jgi:aminocarboxymuconate-semialdehyde decarboxylase